MHPLIAEFFNDDFLNNKERYNQDQIDDINEECLEHMFALDYTDLKKDYNTLFHFLVILLDNCNKELFHILYDIIFLSNVTNKEKLILNGEEVTNILPYVVYKENCVIYGYEKLYYSPDIDNELVSFLKIDRSIKNKKCNVKTFYIISEICKRGVEENEEIASLYVNIPNEIEGVKITEIFPIVGTFWDSHMRSCIKIKQIPESIMTIGDGAFTGCSGISGRLNLPFGLTTVGNSAFSGCSGISGKLNLPFGLTTIGYSAFSRCSKITEKLIIPENIDVIERSAFDGCYGITQLSLPKRLVRIRTCAFQDCYGIKGELVFPNKLEVIESAAFVGCSGITGLVFSEGIQQIDYLAFGGCDGITGELILPKSLKIIKGSTFCNCDNINQVTLLNPQTIIEHDETFPKTTIIKGYPNSTAEEFATKFGYKFEYI